VNLKLIESFFVPKMILDIGANVGHFYEKCKLAFPDSYVFCIEANANCEEELKKVASDYKIALLGNENKRVKFYRAICDDKASGNSIYRELTPFFRDGNLVVTEEDMVKLDDLCFPISFDHPNFQNQFDLVKMDTQGSEVDIIRGGAHLCCRAKGLLLEVSYEPYNRGAPLQDEVERFLEGIDFFHVAILHEDFRSRQRDVLYLNARLFARNGRERT
jgi:FkbM family methyltransferase